MSRKVKFYLGNDNKSLQEHILNEKTDWFSNLTSIFYSLFRCC